MMRLLRAEFRNFRLLKNLSVEFSSEAGRPLTVFRAENESGKTTMLTALQWALYGDDALPGRGEDYRIHPIDWDAGSSPQVPIEVVIEYEVESVTTTPAGQSRSVKNTYRLVRSTAERIKGNRWERTGSTLKLAQLTRAGDLPLNEPEAIVQDHLPPELREVFFTDGDRALSFIEAGLSTTTKRDRVEKAIRALLGLSVLEAAKKHVKDASVEINRKARSITNSDQLNKVSESIESTGTLITGAEEELQRAKDAFDSCDQNLVEIDKQIQMVLQKGDQEALSRDLERSARSIKSLDTQLEALEKEHSSLFKSPSLARDLLSTKLGEAMRILDTLRDQGKIPNTTIPVLLDRLALKECVCGESLDGATPEGAKRRAYMESTIARSKKDDEVQILLTEIYYRSKSFVYDDSREGAGWLKQYSDFYERRDGIQRQRDDEGQRLRSLQTRLDSLGNTDITQLRNSHKLIKHKRDEANRQVSVCSTRISDAKSRLLELTKERDRLLREESKGAIITGQLRAVEDLLGVLDGSLEKIGREELAKVSEAMNTIFIRVIGADPKERAVIRKSEITPDYDIIVEGAEGRRLNPDQDLNGASRRALTLSFILALTKVSDVTAPNIIDTPLGMMAGFVKREALRTVINGSSQPILFLTSDEIAGCEDILDASAGTIITLTNPAHYPRILVNKPATEVIEIVRCNCNHRSRCKVCDRRLDEDAKGASNVQ